MFDTCLKDRVQKVHDIEQKVWADELADMRQVVDEELRAIRHMAAGLYPTSTSLLMPSYLCNGIETEQPTVDADLDDGSFDVDSMRLKLGIDEDCLQPPIPEFYLSQSPMCDGGQSLSWYVIFSDSRRGSWHILQFLILCIHKNSPVTSETAHALTPRLGLGAL